jgi:hypothetical protein
VLVGSETTPGRLLEGSLAGVPVFVRYQPRWWFKVEGGLDAEETR